MKKRWQERTESPACTGTQVGDKTELMCYTWTAGDKDQGVG